MDTTSKDRHPVVSARAERLFYAWLSLAILGVTLFGFLRSYLLLPVMGFPEGLLPPTVWVHAHAAIFFSWCILLVVQSLLVVWNRVAFHRTLGMVGLCLFLGMVITGPIVAVRSVVRQGSPTEELAFLAVSLGNVLAYTLILGAAFHWRHSPAIHKRLVMLGMVALLTAPFGRVLDLPYHLSHVAGPGFVVIAMGIWDYVALRKVHSITLFVGLGVLLWELAPNLYKNSPWWLAFARWLTSLALNHPMGSNLYC